METTKTAMEDALAYRAYFEQRFAVLRRFTNRYAWLNKLYLGTEAGKFLAVLGLAVLAFMERLSFEVCLASLLISLFFSLLFWGALRYTRVSAESIFFEIIKKSEVHRLQYQHGGLDDFETDIQDYRQAFFTDAGKQKRRQVLVVGLVVVLVLVGVRVGFAYNKRILENAKKTSEQQKKKREQEIILDERMRRLELEVSYSEKHSPFARIDTTNFVVSNYDMWAFEEIRKLLVDSKESIKEVYLPEKKTEIEQLFKRTDAIIAELDRCIYFLQSKLTQDSLRNALSPKKK